MIDENDVQEHAFELIFAFDEVVALGYRESVNLAQIRTFTEMDSHEEKVFLAVRKVANYNIQTLGLNEPFYHSQLQWCVNYGYF